MIEMYHILQFSLPVDLEHAVNNLISSGWQPLGAPIQGRDGKLMQPMILPAKEARHDRA